MSVLKKETGIIVAFDMEDVESAKRLAEELRGVDGNVVIKIGRPLEMQSGVGIISEIKKLSDLPVIYDGKIADIPFISSKIANIAFDEGADAVIVHSFVGSDVVRELLNLGRGDVIVVVEMSHPGASEYMAGVSEELTEMVLRMGADGMVLPATRPDRVKKLASIFPEAYVISPGIKAQGAKVGDAIASGADYEVIGRAIYNADDSKKATEELYGQLKRTSKRSHTASG
ncbi:MAG: orotidine-5'-phosphate decarboxylase [Halobacteriota archaeon]|nr:orotidine-5'-phosphate decarboxylase [Halobacteriota archaeon]